jgi:Na+/phosphate symporter
MVFMPEQTVKDLKKELYLMMHKAQEMLELAEDAFAKNKATALDQAAELAREIHRKEDVLTEALSKMAAKNGDARSLVGVPGHVEKIATSIERIVDGVRVKIKEGLLFSDKATQETGRLLAKGKEVLKKAGEAIVTASPESLETVRIESDEMIRMSNDFATSHEDRLVAGECSPKTSSNYLCILYAFEDIASHAKDAVKKIAAK